MVWGSMSPWVPSLLSPTSHTFFEENDHAIPQRWWEAGQWWRMQAGFRFTCTWDVMESQGVDQETGVAKGSRGLGNQSRVPKWLLLNIPPCEVIRIHSKHYCVALITSTICSDSYWLWSVLSCFHYSNIDAMASGQMEYIYDSASDWYSVSVRAFVFRITVVIMEWLSRGSPVTPRCICFWHPLPGQLQRPPC